MSTYVVLSAPQRHTTARKCAGAVERRCSEWKVKSQTEVKDAGVVRQNVRSVVGCREAPVVGKRMPLVFGSAGRLDVRRAAHKRLCWTPSLMWFQSCQSMKSIPTSPQERDPRSALGRFVLDENCFDA